MGLVAENITPYQFRLDRGNYPLETIYEAASLSGKRGEEIAEQQVQLLQSQHKIIRYWAAIGLRSQSQDVLRSYKEQLISAMEDPYPPVVITASAIAYDLFKDKTAEENLKKYCADGNKDLALMAINYLLYVNDQKPFIETIKEVYYGEEISYEVSAASKDFLGSLGFIPNNFEHR
ncbi:MAG: hypothetical protein WD426_17385 [Anditalea sp.]